MIIGLSKIFGFIGLVDLQARKTHTSPPHVKFFKQGLVAQSFLTAFPSQLCQVWKPRICEVFLCIYKSRKTA